jgi:uncharacterized membrane protein YhaH (DUF805 family)
MNAYIKAFKNFFNFKDRSSRSDFWLFNLFNLIVTILLSGISIGAAMNGVPEASTIISIVLFIISLPGISLVFRRIHDVNKSGWYFLLFFIPIINLFAMLYFSFAKTVTENNTRGEVI